MNAIFILITGINPRGKKFRYRVAAGSGVINAAKGDPLEIVLTALSDLEARGRKPRTVKIRVY